MQWLKTDQQAVNWGLIFSAVLSLAILLLGARQIGLELEPDPGVGAIHYDWQLANPNVWSQITIWGGCLLHLLAIWGVTYYAQKNTRQYKRELRPFNYWALGINAVFCLLHYVQTAVFYDSIAQYIPSWTAQAAVIVMLVVILALENERRGLFFGRKAPLKAEFIRWLKDYHGYVFSFAIIYTFWYHPMVPTPGHIFGFFYTMLVLVQGSLMFTRMHNAPRWKFLLEILVLPHAAWIAYFQGVNILWMFLFGFAGLFIVTQMHGLNLKRWLRWTFYTAFLALVIVVYFFVRQPSQINEVIRIPMIEYLSVFAIYGVWLLVTWIAGRIKPLQTPQQTAAGD